MIQTVDIFKQIAANLTANVVIDAAIDNLDGTFTLETTNTQWVSELEIYSIGGFDYKIESLIQNESLIISPVSNGVLPTATGFVIPAPTFINGTLKMAKNEVDAIKNKMNLVPFIYLYEVIKDRKNTDDESTIERECDLRFFFINSSSFQNMLTEDVYEKVIYTIEPLVELFIAKIKASPLFTDVLNYEEINLINFSEDGNQINSVFDLNLSAIELRLQAEIRSVNCDDIYTNPNPTCLPVRITDENVVVEVAAGMAYTCANSEPCPPAEITFTFDNNLIAVVDTSAYNIDCSTYLDVAIITNNATFNGTYIANGTQNGQTKYVNTLNSNLVIIGGAAWEVVDLAGTTITQEPPTGQDYPWESNWGGQLTMAQATIYTYCGGGACAGVTVEVNGDLFGTGASGGTLNVPVAYENGDAVPTTIVSGVVEVPNPITQSGIAYQIPLPTGQLTSYRTGDDRWRQLNIPSPANPAYPLYYQQLDFSAANPFVTLLYNNIHANKDRFTARDGSQTYATGIVQDHLTRLEVTLEPIGTTDWNGCIDGALALSLGGNDDWFLGDTNIYNAVVNYEASLNLNYAPFNLNTATAFFTSTTDSRDTTRALQFNNATNANYDTAGAKTISSRYYLAFRWF